MKAAQEKFIQFHKRICQLALMTDTLKVQEILGMEYGIHLSEDETRTLRGFNPKIFTFRVIELWVAKQPQEALAWAASISWPNMIGVDLLQLFLDAARKTAPHLNREALDGMLPEGPGKAKALDLAGSRHGPLFTGEPYSRLAHPAERVPALKALAQGWPDPESSAEWARQNLSGADKAVFYSQVGYEKNPQAAFDVWTI